jgi:hypothetical protein
MVYFVIYLAMFIIWITIELLRAPAGYEDETGFHLADTPEHGKGTGRIFSILLC